LVEKRWETGAFLRYSATKLRFSYIPCQKKKRYFLGGGVKTFVILSRFASNSIWAWFIAVTKCVTKIYFCRVVFMNEIIFYFCHHGATTKKFIKGD
jgi:hypothetical protein